MFADITTLLIDTAIGNVGGIPGDAKQLGEDAGAGMIHAITGVADIIALFHKDWQREKDKAISGQVITDFMKHLNEQGSAQRQYQDEFRQSGPGSAYRRLGTP